MDRLSVTLPASSFHLADLGEKKLNARASAVDARAGRLYATITTLLASMRGSITTIALYNELLQVLSTSSLHKPHIKQGRLHHSRFRNSCSIHWWFQAQPPCTVHLKAYEFSRKMPPVLGANLLPRLLLWADPFEEECPDLQDVGFYFFPDDNIAGSRQTYALLFEVMDTQNSVMRIYFDGVDAVDLLIFTSTQLHFYSPNTVTSPRKENFLWGIFRDKNHCRAGMDDNRTTVDMEVDMKGGKMVGTVDVVVPKDSSTPYREPEPIMEKLQQLLNIKKDEHYSYLTSLRVLDSTVKMLLAFNSDEPPVKDEHSASEMKTTCPVQVKLEKDAAETCLETYKKQLTSLPCFPEPSPQSGAGSTVEIVGATSTLDEIAIPRMLCNIDNSR